MERNETNDTRTSTTLSPRAVIVQQRCRFLLARALAVAAELAGSQIW